MGDRVLYLIAVDLMVEIDSTLASRRYTSASQALLSNASLSCLGERSGLCRHYNAHASSFGVNKRCADLFEALVGAMYYEYYYNRNMKYAALNLVRQWLVDDWGFETLARDALLKGEDTCRLDLGNGPWSEWSSCQNGQQKRTRECRYQNLGCSPTNIQTQSCTKLIRLSMEEYEAITGDNPAASIDFVPVANNGDDIVGDYIFYDEGRDNGYAVRMKITPAEYESLLS